MRKVSSGQGVAGRTKAQNACGIGVRIPLLHIRSIMPPYVVRILQKEVFL